MFELFNTIWPRKVEAAPNKIKTIENPKENKINGIMLISFFSKSSFKDEPEIYDIYPGIKGKTHGDKKLNKPALKATNNSIID